MEKFRRGCIVATILGLLLPLSSALYLSYMSSELAATYRGILEVQRSNAARLDREGSTINPYSAASMREFNLMLEKDLEENIAYRQELNQYEEIAWHLAVILPILAIITFISGHFIVSGRLPFFGSKK